MKYQDAIGFPKDLPPEFTSYFVAYHNKILEQQEEIASLRRMLYGRKCEKFIKEEAISLQGTLFNDAELLAEQEEQGGTKEQNNSVQDIQSKGEEQEKSKSTKQTENKGGRKPLPNDLPRESKIHDLEPEQKICPYDHSPLKEIGEDVVEKLEIEPAKFKVVEHHYKKYACLCCTQFVTKQKACASILPGSIAEPSLFAHVVTNKFLFHLPLYRQEMLFAQIQIDLPRTTLARWILAAAKTVEPLVELIKNFVLQNEVVHCDETPLQVLKGTGKKPTAKTFMWVMASCQQHHPAVFYKYYADRSKNSALDFLQGFDGFLQVDGYDAYNALCQTPHITRVGCLSHVRRKFEAAASEGAPEGQSLAKIVLEKIQALFLLERQWSSLTPDERLEQRKIHSKPIMSQLRHTIDKELYKIPPKSKLGKAMSYMANEWEYLLKFLDNGLVALSNNAVENAIRPLALGRRNWLFANTVNGAQASATLYSLVITALKNNLFVEKYLAHLFSILPQVKNNPNFDYSPLLPWNIPQEFKRIENSS